ncbi:hypothetical protein ABZ671_00820 [Micromonospora sp. NPDC006766]|uniref:hypothetical protein n=1 Tax=Micromonospora sp. NPDC006766 TaxID=3154778 RepID=UPI00340DF051
MSSKLSGGVGVCLLLACAAFGPYLAAGVRTEQVAVYGVALLVLLSMVWATRLRHATGTAQAVVLLMAVQIAAATVGMIGVGQVQTIRAPGSAVSGFDNLLLPVAVILTVVTLVNPGRRRAALNTVCTVAAVAACTNAALAWLSTTTDLSAWLSPWWSHGGDLAESVQAKQSETGRYAGMFVQPAEAGEFYSIALIAAVYRLRNHAALLTAAAAIITVGGLLVASKVFLFVGAPVAVILMLAMPSRRGARYTMLAAACYVIAVAAIAGHLDWLGVTLPAQFMDDGGDLNLFTAGRFGSAGPATVVTGWKLVTTYSPIVGFGAGGLWLPYDNGWLEAAVTGGLLGAAAYTGVFVALIAGWWRSRRPAATAESALAAGLIAVAVGTSLGLPGTTANRVATVLWLLLALLLFVKPCPDGAPGRHRLPGRAAAGG